MITSVRAALIAALFMMAMTGTAGADEPATPAEILRTGAEAAVAHGFPGVIGLVRRGSETQYVHAGYGDLATRAAADPAAQFRIGSFTKAFVAVVVLQLETERRLTLDDPLDRWIPGAVPGGTAITLRQVLDHTSGLAEYTSDPRVALPYLANTDPRQPWDPQELVNIATSLPRGGAPGERFSYANTNYLLAGMVITAVTGNHPAVEVRTRIIEPLHLRDTTFPTTDPTLRGNWLHGYTWQRDVSFSNPQVYGAAGAMVSTLDDFATFARALHSGQLLAPAQQRELTTTMPMDGSVGSYVLGAFRAQTPCGGTWVYVGLVLGYAAQMMMSDDGSRQVVAAANEYHLLVETPGNYDLGDAIIRAYCAR
ncbi:serine hydrolase domain-containing protein [Nocardia sp. GCM10030253]|uniref:serine hydrolase domain-containing protein n=1 Tax=Nocardia sp. GCM10030253 TaxID=3273404 RepID=UPI003643966F